jgi:hypothetical protein
MDQNLQSASGELASATQNYNKLASEAPSITDRLRSALTERLSNPEITQRNAAVGNFFETAPRARQQALTELSSEAVPADPLQVQRNIQAQRSAALLPVANLTDLFAAKRGTIDDTVSAGGRAFEGLVAGAKGRVNLAQQNYNLALDALTRMDESQQQAFSNEWAIKQVTGGDITLPGGGTIHVPSEVERTLATKTGTGTEGEDEGYSELLNILLGGGQGTGNQTTEPMPTYNPGAVSAVSSGGQWAWDYQSGSWLPIVD